ncbi:MAG TPA: hypothetical protein EYP35_08850 [Desulfobacterales bacterium]|nr:hypothetical protein [Desulfobacterales bacterium]HIP38384.1 hypothetical protein [Desulfocapsa sulfexigens]
MSPIRLVIIGLLLYIGYKLVTGDWKKKTTDKAKKSVQDKQDDSTITDVLVEDPVCHKLVPRQQAVRLEHKTRKETIFFCSEACCKQFVSQEGDKE